LAADRVTGAAPTTEAADAGTDATGASAADVTGAAALVTADVTGAAALLTADVTGAAALATADVTGVAALAAAATGAESVLAELVPGERAGTEPADPAGEAAEAAGEPEVSDETADVAGEAAGDSVEVTDVSAAGVPFEGAEVAACACRENTSMTTKIPAATTASCTARTAMRRAIGCGISSSPSPGNRSWPVCPQPAT